MKIEIDLNNSLPLKGQIYAVEQYIRDNIIGKIGFDCWGEEILKGDKNSIPFSEIPVLEETPKNTGFKVYTDFGNYHVSCSKTKGGMYKFKTWKAV